jgi:hypothetical protein
MVLGPSHEQPEARYRHWLTVRALGYAIGRSDDWLPRLQGGWIRPTGDVSCCESARLIKTPRTISSSMFRAQSEASRFVRNVLLETGHPVLRITAFHFPAGVFVSVAKVR